jgi:hypothetical protein
VGDDTDIAAKLFRSLDPEARRQDFARQLESDPRGTAESGRKRAALRLFLQHYRDFKPEVLSALAEIGKQPAPGGFLPRDFRAFALAFFLPNSIVLAMECTATLAAWKFSQIVSPDLWHFEAPTGRVHDLYPPAVRHEFTFRAPGWDVRRESLAQAHSRLEAAFREQLEAQSAAWRISEEARAELRSFIGSASRQERRNLRWLAEKQALNMSDSALAKSSACSKETVRTGINCAAEYIGLPKARIRRARPTGRPRSR